MKEFVGTDTKALDTKALTAQTLKEKGRNIGKACWGMQCDDENPDNDDDLYTCNRSVFVSLLQKPIVCHGLSCRPPHYCQILLAYL